MFEQKGVTVIVLVAGVFGGLVIIVLLMLCYKHCGKSSQQNVLVAENGDTKIGNQIEVSTNYGVNQKSPVNDKVENQRLLGKGERTERGDTVESSPLSVESHHIPTPSSLRSEKQAVCSLDIELPDKHCMEHTMVQSSSSNQSRLLEREPVLSANGTRSRPPSRLNIAACHGSRRTLQSSVDSSVCTDNRSECTVIEASSCEARVLLDPTLDLGARSASQEEPHNYQPSRTYISAFRPIPKRRQSTQTELVFRPPKERCERLIKSQDDASCLPSHNLQRQTRILEGGGLMQYANAHQEVDMLPPTDIKNSKNLESPAATYCQRGYNNGDTFCQRGYNNGETDSHSRGYKKLWQLRSNLELCSTFDEDGVSQVKKTAGLHSNGQVLENGEKQIVCNVVCASVDSENSRSIAQNVAKPFTPDEGVHEDNLLHPPEQTYVNKRQHFQRILKNRGRSGLEGNSSTEKSFDSFDTSTTDGARSSASSRVEVTTTSFESSSTTTDSDSYYKSRFNNRSAETHVSPSVPNSLGFAFDSPDIEQLPEEPSKLFPSHGLSKSASKRRRDFQNRHFSSSFGKNKHNIVSSHSSIEVETTDSNCISGDSFDDHHCDSRNAKRGVFYKFLHPNSRHDRRPEMRRDYSVDEKTDALFREFMRYDPTLDHKFNRRALNKTSRSRSEGSSEIPIPNSLVSEEKVAAQSPVNSVSTSIDLVDNALAVQN